MCHRVANKRRRDLISFLAEKRKKKGKNAPGRNQRRTRSANALFSLFMAVGNVLGFAAGSYSKWYKLLPFTRTVACDVNCANLKSAFFIAIIVTITATILSISSVPERRWSPLSERKPIIPAPCASAPQDAKAEAIAKAGDVQDDDDEELSEAFIWELFTAFWDLPHSMWYLLLVTALTWIAWFPFLLFDTDWMGREVYRGEPSGHSAFSSLYDQGVRAGAFGLMLNAIMLGATSLMVDFLAGKFGPRLLWAMANLILSVSLACTGLITKAAEVYTNEPSSPPAAVKISAMVLFSVLGVPLAVTYSIPFALAATFSSSSGAGQGLSMGVLNLSVVIPQIIVSLGSGPWDALFGGGNLPAFMLASVSALAGAIAILTWLPSPPPDFPSSHILRTQSSPFP